jgi:hypothetical protein
MTSPKAPNLPSSGPSQPQPPRLRPSDERALLAASGRTTRRIAVAAVGLAVLALALTTFRAIVPGSTSSTVGSACQQTAWDAMPSAGQMPKDWTVQGATYEINRKSMSLLGPAPADGTSAQAVIYVTVTCYPTGASDAMTRAAAASKDAGQTVDNRPDLGDQAFSALDGSGARFLQLRHGDVVVDLAASGDATQTEVDQLASGFDRALGGDGGTIATPGPSLSPDPSADASVPAASGPAAASESPAAPELEKLLPTTVGQITLTVSSATGSTVLGQDEGSRAIIAALRVDGKSVDALRYAEAYDDTTGADLQMFALAVNGMSIDKVRRFVLDTWLTAAGPGVTTTSVTLAGHPFTRIDYGDEGPVNYVTTKGDAVIYIKTSDPSLAEQAAAALP